MAVRTRFVGQGLGLDPIPLYESDQPDSTFDSTVRIPIKPSGGLQRGQPPTPLPPGLPGTTPVPTGLGASNPPQTWNPQNLNFEGSTYQGPAPYSMQPGLRQPTPTDLQAIQNWMDAHGVSLNRDWRTMLNADPGGFISKLEAGAPGGLGGGRDAPTLGAYMRQVLTGQVQTPNTDAKLEYLNRASYNQAIERLKVLSAQSTRADEESILANLASRGLLHSGIAAKELAGYQQQKMQNLYDAASSLNLALFSSQSDYEKATALAQLEADLQKRNQQSLLELQYRLEKQSQPSPWAQIAGTAIGVGLPLLLSPKSPRTDTSGLPTPYEDPGYRNA